MSSSNKAYRVNDRTVALAANMLLSLYDGEAEAVTIERVRDVLGRGSYSTISEHLAVWRDRLLSGHGGYAEMLRERVEAALESITPALLDAGAAAGEQYRKQADEELSRLRARLADTEQDNAQIKSDLDENRRLARERAEANTGLTKKLQGAQSELAAAQAKLSVLDKENALLSERLDLAGAAHKKELSRIERQLLDERARAEKQIKDLETRLEQTETAHKYALVEQERKSSQQLEAVQALAKSEVDAERASAKAALARLEDIRAQLREKQAELEKAWKQADTWEAQARDAQDQLVGARQEVTNAAGEIRSLTAALLAAEKAKREVERTLERQKKKPSKKS